MAKSDYETLAFNDAGQPCDGIFKSPQGTIVECYKNRLHFGHNKMWRNKGNLIKPWIGTVGRGKAYMSFHDVGIETAEAPQNGMFFILRWMETIKKRGGKRNEMDYIHHYSGGIVCSWYCLRIPRKLRDKGIKDLSEWGHSSMTGQNKSEHFLYGPKNQQVRVDRDPAYWAGVKPATVRQFFKWAEGIVSSDEGEAWLAKCRKSGGVRFNQGNAYFARVLGVPLEASAPGKAAKPILIKAIKNMAKK